MNKPNWGSECSIRVTAKTPNGEETFAEITELTEEEAIQFAKAMRDTDFFTQDGRILTAWVVYPEAICLKSGASK